MSIAIEKNIPKTKDLKIGMKFLNFKSNATLTIEATRGDGIETEFIVKRELDGVGGMRTFEPQRLHAMLIMNSWQYLGEL